MAFKRLHPGVRLLLVTAPAKMPKQYGRLLY
jgi:hypothetical protein